MMFDTDFDNDIFIHREDYKLEFKESINPNQFYKYKETLCAFLNMDGGQLIFGIRDNLQVVGININNYDLDKFILRIDSIISNGLIMCRDKTKEEKIFGKIPPETIKTRILVNTKNKKFLIINVEKNKDMKYQLTDGSKFYRINASNYHKKKEHLYKEHELRHAVCEAEKKANKLNAQNIKLFQKIINEKNEQINKLKIELELKNNVITDYQQYLVNPLMDKLNNNLNEDEPTITSIICDFTYDLFGL